MEQVAESALYIILLLFWATLIMIISLFISWKKFQLIIS